MICEERFISKSECVGSKFVFYPKLVASLDKVRRSKPKNVLVEGSRTRQVRGGIDDKGKFDVLHSAGLHRRDLADPPCQSGTLPASSGS